MKAGEIRLDNPLRDEMLKAIANNDLVLLPNKKYRCLRNKTGYECLSCPYKDCLDTACKTTEEERNNNANMFIDSDTKVHANSNKYKEMIKRCNNYGKV